MTELDKTSLYGHKACCPWNMYFKCIYFRQGIIYFNGTSVNFTKRQCDGCWSDFISLTGCITVSARTDHSGGRNWRPQGPVGGRGQSRRRGGAYRKSPSQTWAQGLSSSSCRLGGLTETYTNEAQKFQPIILSCPFNMEVSQIMCVWKFIFVSYHGISSPGACVFMVTQLYDSLCNIIFFHKWQLV